VKLLQVSDNTISFGWIELATLMYTMAHRLLRLHKIADPGAHSTMAKLGQATTGLIAAAPGPIERGRRVAERGAPRIGAARD
jgi:hypothetical protein